jgi:hypothetical protein
LVPALDRERKTWQRLDVVDGTAVIWGRPILRPGAPELVWVEQFDCAIVAAEAVYLAEIVSDVRERIRLDYASFLQGYPPCRQHRASQHPLETGIIFSGPPGGV